MISLSIQSYLHHPSISFHIWLNCNLFYLFFFLDRVSVPIADVIAVDPVLSSNDDGVNNGQGQPEQQQQFKCFTVVYAKRCGHSANANKWRYHTVSLHNNDYRIVNVWIRTLQTTIRGM